MDVLIRKLSQNTQKYNVQNDMLNGLERVLAASQSSKARNNTAAEIKALREHIKELFAEKEALEKEVSGAGLDVSEGPQRVRGR